MPRKQYTTHFIYKTTCLITNKFYIGMHSTFNIDDEYLGSGKYLWNSIKKHGKENHKREIIEFCNNRIELQNREREIVNEQLIQHKKCMNLKIGGDGFPPGKTWGRHLGAINMNKTLAIKVKTDLEYRKRFCKAISDGINNSPIKCNCNWTGRKHSLETKEKMRLSSIGKQTGEKNSQYGTCWITNGTENKKIKKDVEIPINWKLGRTLK